MPGVAKDRDGQDAGRDPGGLLNRLRAELDRRGLGTVDPEAVPEPDPEGRTHAAVLVLLYPHAPTPRDEAVPHLALTRRTEALRRHSGQISLPGVR